VSKRARTERQRATSRKNGKRSRGPRTAAGKRAVRLNRLRHGLRARQLVLPNESMNELEQVRSAFWTAFNPVGAIEETWADRAVAALWRLRRLEVVETGLLSNHMNGMREQRLKVPLFNFNVDSYVPAEVSREHALLVAEQTTDQAMLARAFAAEAPTFLILSRYETTLMRALVLAVSQLEARQAARLLSGQGDATKVSVSSNKLDLADQTREKELGGS
jgi:hypothetical protein